MINTDLVLPRLSFAEMETVLQQHSLGLLSTSEAIISLQCVPVQVAALESMRILPLKARDKLSVTDMEPDWERLKINQSLEDDARIGL